MYYARVPKGTSYAEVNKERMKGKIDMKKNRIARGTIKGFAVTILALGLVLGFGPAARTATSSLQPGTSSGFQFVADGYGTQATLGSTVVAGKTAVSSLGACGIVQPPVHNEKTVASTDATPLFTTGVVNTTADGTTLVDGTLQAMATADVLDASLLITALGGVITADEVKA